MKNTNKMGVALWLYPEKDVIENISIFAKEGYGAVSYHGEHFIALDSSMRDKVADALKQNKLAFTIHGKLPSPSKKEKQESIRGEIDGIYAWHKKHNALTGLTFDISIGATVEFLHPYLSYMLEKFSDTDVFICLEDCPLNENEKKPYNGLEKKYPNLGILADLGHMNLRINEDLKQGKDPSDVLKRYFHNIPFPIPEIHVHNNDGIKDLHADLRTGTLPINIAAKYLNEIGFKGISTIEVAPTWAGLKGEAIYESGSESRKIWEKAIG